jgi:TolB-like protein/Tfp pilus assembly protein PilF
VEAEPPPVWDSSTERQSLSAHRAAQPQESGSRRLVLGAIVLAVIVLAGLFGYRYLSNTGRINSIAVLPLQNSGGNADSEYLSDGLAESLIYRLSQLPDLKVSPASSVMRYKGKEFDAQKIAAELGVQAVMSGRMVQRGDNLSISVELIDAVNNKTIWGEQFERKMSDLLATQREIATVITEKLQLKLTGSENTGITKKYTDNNEAYQLYLKGRYFWNKRTEPDINRSIELFNDAIKLDPKFALAYSGLADSYQVLPSYQEHPKPSETYPKARAMAEKALEIDPTLAEPHAAIGVVYHEYEWKFADAEREFKRSIELNPNYPSAHQWYAEYLANMNRHDESIAEMKRALELDPMSLIINTTMGGMYYVARRYDESLAQFRKVFEIDPNFIKAHVQLISIYRAKGMYEETLDELRKTRELAGADMTKVDPRIDGVRAAYRSNGPKGFWKAVMDIELENARITKTEPDPFALADCLIGVGDNDRAIATLQKAFETGNREIGMVQLKSDPIWDPIRPDPRFQELLKKIGFSRIEVFMKLCPECRKNYIDETLNFCLDDGSALIAVSPSNEPATAILSGQSGDKATELLAAVSLAEPASGNSIAVLPFVNMSADADNEYFCDGPRRRTS